MFKQTDYTFMSQAIELAHEGKYSTSPNPCVGCIITDGMRIAKGFHKQAGGPHAEVNALIDAKEKGLNLSKATCYVTLEPCSFTGKTGPCADALVKAGVKRVVYGMKDPNPKVSGAGLAKLEAAGIQVDGPLLEADAEQTNPGFFKRMATGKPLVFAKTAASLDGRTAMQNGESKWITGPKARAHVQKLRAKSCAIITGIGTILADDPALTVRDESLALEDLPLRQPLRVILDSQLRIPLDAKVLTEPGDALIVYAQDPENRCPDFDATTIECIALPDKTGRIDLQQTLDLLSDRQCHTLMVEAGSTLVGSFLQQNLLDEVVAFIAPTLLGSDARAMAQLPFTKMNEQLRFRTKQLSLIGNDLCLTLIPD